MLSIRYKDERGQDLAPTLEVYNLTTEGVKEAIKKGIKWGDQVCLEGMVGQREIVLSTHLSSKYLYGGKLGVRERRKIKL